MVAPSILTNCSTPRRSSGRGPGAPAAVYGRGVGGRLRPRSSTAGLRRPGRLGAHRELSGFPPVSLASRRWRAYNQARRNSRRDGDPRRVKLSQAGIVSASTRQQEVVSAPRRDHRQRRATSALTSTIFPSRGAHVHYWASLLEAAVRRSGARWSAAATGQAGGGLPRPGEESHHAGAIGFGCDHVKDLIDRIVPAQHRTVAHSEITQPKAKLCSNRCVDRS